MQKSNYRIVRKQLPSGEKLFNLHEVFYDKHGNPEFCSGNVIKHSSEDIKELRALLICLFKALDKPALKYEDF